jgi:hypothetical protein
MKVLGGCQPPFFERAKIALASHPDYATIVISCHLAPVKLIFNSAIYEVIDRQ